MYAANCSNVEESILFSDSKGNFWKKRKNKSSDMEHSTTDLLWVLDFKIISNEEQYQESISLLKEFFLERNYPADIVDKALSNFFQTSA